jgi:integrase
MDAHALHTRSQKPLLKEAGLPPNLRLHALRHTLAILLLTKGVHPKIVSEVLGHANIGIILDTHSHVLPNMQEKAVAAMDAIFEGSVAGYRQDGVLVRTALPIKTAGAMSHLGFMG